MVAIRGKKNLIPEPRSRFLKVACPECANEMVIFDRCSTVIKCDKCGAKVADPTGGKAKIYGNVIEVLDKKQR